MKQIMEFVDYKCLESLLITGEEIAVTEGLTDKIKSAAKFIGKHRAQVNISACALGKRKTAYGYGWTYVDQLLMQLD